MTQVVSSISGIEIYSPSAGYAPTNSGDVSAIASSYQVVSSTATQLYAGTAFLTGVNGDPISASRAGQAANASLANSAYYDGTGRLISALPDSAAVSSIASSYADSAMSSKLDSTAFSTVSGDFLTAETVSSIATAQYGPQPTDVGVTTINGFGLIAKSADTAYSAVYASIAKTDDNLRVLTSLADSAAVSSIASSYAESAASSKADSSSLSAYALSSNVSGVIDTVSANSASWSGGSLPITGTSGDDSASYDAYHVEFTRYDTAGEPDIRTAEMSPDHFYIEYTLDGNDYTSMTLNESMLNFTLPDGDRYVDAYSIDTWNSAVDTVSSNSATWGQGGVDSATVSAIASSYAESAASSKLDSSASSSFYTTANESGYVGSAYVDSAVSGKMDTSAIDYTRTGGGTQIYATGTGSSTNQFSAKNDSAGAAIIAGENARLRLWDTAATANLYASSIGRWNAASNLVSTQSANWGGSALALSAGPGISLTMVGNTLVISTAGV